MADPNEYGRHRQTIVDIAEELEQTHLARVPQVLKKLEQIRQPEDEMRQAAGMRLSKKYDSGV
ncbi:uncharacterized protein Dana_GF12209 [Drosophila ananassae]|uniref:Uncharacterized protein n=1 Tax=Drosophila ananassae TaxID=7217 RepID=B3MIQ5_DROAN|nr:uncharacterized protein LOC6495064 [Drosophila ananassae]EDV35965.1 uncharacterized protein Dana_GF12209 [Drosophila ananassae]